MMSAGWVGERVAVPDIRKVVQGTRLDRDEVSWGPNSRFRFPKRGGTGAIWETFMQGWECVDRLLSGSGPETEHTLHGPDGTNARYDE